MGLPQAVLATAPGAAWPLTKCFDFWFGCQTKDLLPPLLPTPAPAPAHGSTPAARTAAATRLKGSGEWTIEKSDQAWPPMVTSSIQDRASVLGPLLHCRCGMRAQPATTIRTSHTTAAT